MYLKNGKKVVLKAVSTIVLSLVVAAGEIPGADFAMTVHADDNKSIEGLGVGPITVPDEPLTMDTAWSGSYVWYGSTAPNKYRVLAPSTTTYNASHTMLLDCDTILEKNRRFANIANAEWASSDLKGYLNGKDFLNNNDKFTDQEREAIAASTVAGHRLDTGYPQDNWFKNYVGLDGEKIFILDFEDVINTSYGYYKESGNDGYIKEVSIGNRIKKDYGGTEWPWWLRSRPIEIVAAWVDHDGIVIHQDGPDNSGIGVSPAFNINLSSVIFTSLISGTAGSAGAEYKLTIADRNLGIKPGTVTRYGTTITVPYTITGTNRNNTTQISVLITDSEYSAGTAITSGYTYLKLSGGTSGSGTFTLPDSYADQTCGTDYYAYILAEDVNAGSATDYACTPIAITIPDAKPTLTITAKDKTYSYNGQTQEPRDTVYTDPDEIAGMVTVEGLQSGDMLTSITVDGQGKEVGDYDLTPSSAMINNSSASDKYDVKYVKGKLHITSAGKFCSVTFKVKNGAWNDGTKADKTVTLSGGAGDTLKLSTDQIPTAGSKPDTHYKEGSWDVTPETGAVITSDTTYIYTYADDEPQPGKCTITFNPNGGKGEMAPQKAERGETVKLNTNEFTRSGYEFKNWNTKADGSGDNYDDKQSFKFEADMTLYAQWEEEGNNRIKGDGVTVEQSTKTMQILKSSLSWELNQKVDEAITDGKTNY